jgi:soluble lytic murein transglycosylase-like protein
MATAFALATPVVAHAQIYAWRDASGNLVLSDKARDPSAKTYAVATSVISANFRTTKPLSRRAAQYQSLIEEHASRNTVSADLVRALIQAESAFNPRALSPKGAMGLMQLMPATAVEYVPA